MTEARTPFEIKNSEWNLSTVRKTNLVPIMDEAMGISECKQTVPLKLTLIVESLRNRSRLRKLIIKDNKNGMQSKNLSLTELVCALYIPTIVLAFNELQQPLK